MLAAGGGDSSGIAEHTGPELDAHSNPDADRFGDLDTYLGSDQLDADVQADRQADVPADQLDADVSADE